MQKFVLKLELSVSFDERFKVTSVQSPDFNLLSCELDNFIFEVFH